MKQQVPGNPEKNREGIDMPLVIIAALLVTLYLTSNIMSVKIISVGGCSILDAGTITFPFAYMLGDVLTEIWGFKTSKRIIWLTFFCNLLLVLFTAIGVMLPSPDSIRETAAAYRTIFLYVPRIVAASLVAFLAGELSNAYIMERLKRLTCGRHLWLRTIGSSVVGYLLDTVLFVLIAFGGTISAGDILSIMLIQYLVKLLIESLGGTPLAYALVHRLRRDR